MLPLFFIAAALEGECRSETYIALGIIIAAQVYCAAVVSFRRLEK